MFPLVRLVVVGLAVSISLNSVFAENSDRTPEFKNATDVYVQALSSFESSVDHEDAANRADYKEIEHQRDQLLAAIEQDRPGRVYEDALSAFFSHYGKALSTSQSDDLYGDRSYHDLEQLVFDPTSHNFSELSVGESAVQTFTLTNTGTARVHFEAGYPNIVELGSSAYSISNMTCEAGLDAGQSCDIEVTYAPQVSGSPSGFIGVYIEESSDLFTARLSGEAVADETYTMSFNPTSHNFGELAVGESVSQTFTLTNTGTARMHFKAGYPNIVELGSSAYSISNMTCEAGLDAGQSCDIEVTYEPQVSGSPSGFIGVYIEESSDLFTARLRGDAYQIMDEIFQSSFEATEN